MALPYPIASTQTDAKSPIDQQLMDAIRLNQEYLDTAVGAVGGAGIFNFRVNGNLSNLFGKLDQGLGKRLDGGIATNAVTFSKARLYLETMGTKGAVEIDVLRHKKLEHSIKEIVAQYSGTTQSVGRLGTSQNTQSIAQATADISTQTIDFVKSTLNIESITSVPEIDPIGGNGMLIVFSGTTLLDADYESLDYMNFTGCTNAANNGVFQIVQTNYNGLPSVVISNASGVEQLSAAGTGQLGLREYTYLASTDDDFVAGEEVTLSGHTDSNNNGTLLIYKTNQGGNNLWVKRYDSNWGASQASPAGTAKCSRYIYAFSAGVDATQYVVGEKAEMAGHTNSLNNGKFVIKRVNHTGNNLYISNYDGVVQAGAAGTVDTLRWLYSTPSDSSSDISVGDNVKFSGHTSANNDGTFEIKFVNRFAVNNIEVYNENGVAQGGAAGTHTTVYKILKFHTDLSANYTANKSKVLLEGIHSTSDDIIDEFDVVEVNRGGGANYNIVLDAEGLTAQTVAVGRVANEARSLFTSRPRIESPQERTFLGTTVGGLKRTMQVDDTATFDVGGVDADDILTMDILEVMTGDHSNLVLSLS